MLIRTFLIKLGVVYDDSDAKKANKDVETLGDSAAKAQPKLEKLDRELDDTTTSAKKAGTATAKAGTQIKGAGTQAAATGRQVGKLDGLMAKLGTSLASFGPQLAAAGVAGVIAGVGKAIGFLSDETARLDEIAKGAQKSGLGFDAYQRLAQVSKLAGTSIGSLSKGVITLNRNLSKVAEGRGAEVEDNLRLLNLTLEDLQGVDPTQQLAIISDAIGKVDNEVQRTAISMELFGKAGSDLVPLLNSGSEAISEMAASVGKVFTREELARAEAYQDALVNLDKAIAFVAGSLAVTLAPTFQRVIELAENAIPPITGFFQALADRVVPAFRALAKAAEPWVERLGPEAGEKFSALLAPIGLAADAIAFFAQQLAFLLDVGNTILEWIDRLASALETRLASAFEPVGEAIERWLAEPLERVRDLAGEVFDFVEGLVDGIGSLGAEVRSIRSAVGLGGGGGSLGSAQAAAAALAGGATTAQQQAQARQRAQEGGASGRAAERSRQREAFVRGEASSLRRRARRRPRRGGGGSRAAATTPAADQGGFLEQLGLTDPGAIMAKRPAPNAMTIIIAPVIKLIEQLVINVQGGASPEQRRALDDAATQARDAIFVKLKDLTGLVDLIFKGQGKALQSAGSSTTLRGGD